MNNKALEKRKNLEVQNNFSHRGYLDDVFNNFFTDMLDFTHPLINSKERTFLPKIDVSETDNAYFLTAELPGIEEKDINLKINDSVLTIEGKRDSKSEDKNHNYHIKERFFGTFSRSINLPYNIDEDNVNAEFKNGLLNIEIPKKELTKSKTIKINKN